LYPANTSFNLPIESNQTSAAAESLNSAQINPAFTDSISEQSVATWNIDIALFNQAFPDHISEQSVATWNMNLADYIHEGSFWNRVPQLPRERPNLLR
jgi:hypothetical protein